MEFYDMMDKYNETFGEWFPTMCFQTSSEQELMDMMNRCLSSNTKAETLFNLSYVDDIKY